jgi:hypothetical protein
LTSRDAHAVPISECLAATGCGAIKHSCARQRSCSNVLSEVVFTQQQVCGSQCIATCNPSCGALPRVQRQRSHVDSFTRQEVIKNTCIGSTTRALVRVSVRHDNFGEFGETQNRTEKHDFRRFQFPKLFAISAFLRFSNFEPDKIGLAAGLHCFTSLGRVLCPGN